MRNRPDNVHTPTRDQMVMGVEVCLPTSLPYLVRVKFHSSLVAEIGINIILHSLCVHSWNTMMR